MVKSFLKNKKAAAPALPWKEMDVGSTIVFKQTPLSSLSLQSVPVQGVKTYQFDNERLASFVLAPEDQSTISLITSSTGSEIYLALSRLLSSAECNMLFDIEALKDSLKASGRVHLKTRGNAPGLEHWVRPSYVRELQNMKGKVWQGKPDDPAVGTADKFLTTKVFDYYMFVTEENRHAVEIQQYSNGELEVYLTVYREASDILNILPPESSHQVAEAA